MEIYCLHIGLVPKTAYSNIITDEIFLVTGSLQRPLPPTAPQYRGARTAPVITAVAPILFLHPFLFP